MERKLNGFNNGRDTTDGVGGKPGLNFDVITHKIEVTYKPNQHAGTSMFPMEWVEITPIGKLVDDYITENNIEKDSILKLEFKKDSCIITYKL